MLKISLFIIYYFLWVLCTCNTSATFAIESDYPTINRLWEQSKLPLGAFIDANPKFKTPILKNCLATNVRLQDGYLSAVKSEQITQFFKSQGLEKHIIAPETGEKGKIKTFDHTYGFEFPEHGPVEEKTIRLIKSLARQGEVSFLDIGAGYGGFAKRVSDACETEQGNITIFLNECLSVQCYHIANLFKDSKNVLIYPFDILQGLDFPSYLSIDRKFNISTIFNVHHFMTPYRFENSIRNIYKITEEGGYHIAISLSPYFRGDDSILAKEYDHRIAQGTPNPEYFPEEDMGLSVRFPVLFPSKECYENMFQKAGFSIQEAGYFSNDNTKPRQFVYIIGQKPLPQSSDEEYLEDIIRALRLL